MITPPRTTLANGLDISRLVCGLWQVADMEKGGTALDPEIAAGQLDSYARDGFDTFDMASRSVCSLRRLPSNTPLQSFYTLNDEQFVEAAQALGGLGVKIGEGRSAARLRAASPAAVRAWLAAAAR